MHTNTKHSTCKNLYTCIPVYLLFYKGSGIENSSKLEKRKEKTVRTTVRFFSYVHYTCFFGKPILFHTNIFNWVIWLVNLYLMANSHHEERHAGYGWLLVCVLGTMSTLTAYGIVMEYVTSGGRKLHELSFVFITTSIYSLIALICRDIFGEAPCEISKYKLLGLSVTSIASTYTSVRSLRYVIYPVQILFKSCKPVPVMIFGIVLGKKYPIKKYVNVVIITCGVILFMSGGKSSSKAEGGVNGTLFGALLLSISLCFDGATGAYEEKLMGSDHVGPFELMYNIQLGKAVIAFICLVASNGLNDLVHTMQTGGINLVFLGIAGASGQVLFL